MTEPANLQPRTVSYAMPLGKPRATWFLLAIIVLVFVLETLAGGSTETEVLVRLGAKVTPLIAAGEYWRLLTSMFLHIGFAHLLINCYALFAIGGELERLVGWRRFLAIYLLSGLAGSLASYAFSYSLSAGASGAIFGMIGALAAFFLRHRRQLGAWGQRRLANIAFLIVINLVFGFSQPGIDNMAHLGGLLGGLALGWALTPRFEVDPITLRLVDRNSLGRSWPALVLAAAILVSGAGLATYAYRQSPTSGLVRAQDAIDRQAWDEAVAELEGVLARDPTQTDAHFYLGLTRNYLGQSQSAAKAYESAISLDPEFSEAHWNLALTYLELERYADALTHFETYLTLNPDEGDKVQPYLDQLRRLGP